MTVLAAERVSNEGEGSDLKVAPRPSNCKARNNASFRGSIRFLKFVFEAYPIVLATGIRAFFSFSSRNAWAFHEAA